MNSPHADVITIPTESGDLPIHRWLPPGGTGPGVLVLQEIFGVSAYIRSRCADLATAGYVVYAPELYHRLPDSAVDEEDVERGVELAQQLPWDAALADAHACLDALRAAEQHSAEQKGADQGSGDQSRANQNSADQSSANQTTGKVAVLGFCYGGGLAFNLAAQNSPDALVSYYGSALPGLLSLAPQVQAPSLHHFGTADSYIPAEMVETIREAVTATNNQVEFFTYDGAGHAFDNPSPLFHHGQASAEAWQRTLTFLAAHLR
ncbi:dienelactone hydrolase family protein [Ruania halotolerans]|uniref:dienelactone hydrolase family protein n=1 Tax=Ruania halotolerans TaxID=2897773 RepID=UPI001E5D28E4|nr:dienelactone hydrolase family protein [Ruania halotolerans]UFU06267.1 dienelactone hydrolase family protein [Ruania halotolerans]